jgi:3,4-dehydroadipyl-CoA semialdehyde dehydrogenase
VHVHNTWTANNLNRGDALASQLGSFLSGHWQTGEGSETELRDPVTGELLATVSGRGLDLAAALNHARERGGPALREINFVGRAKLLDAIANVLLAKRARYEEIAIANSGNTKLDAAIDIDGGIGTLKYFAKLGAGLGEAKALLDQGPVRLAKDEKFQAIHLLAPRRGVAVHINAFNFPSWGLWEKAAVSLLAGVPVLAKPASSTAWLAHEMVRDVIEAKVLPDGALNLLSGSAGDLFAHLRSDDVIAFTGSHDTAMKIRGDRNVMARGVAVNVEADSINTALLAPGEVPATPVFDAFVKEVSREMTVKAGQKCTAIRRIFVPAEHAAAVAEALSAKLAATQVGDPRKAETRMGPVVNCSQQAAVFDGIAKLSGGAKIIAGGKDAPKIDGVDPKVSAFVLPTLMQTDGSSTVIHDTEVFGPVATIIPYKNEAEAFSLVRRGGGSLVASVFGSDAEFLAKAARELSSAHGRILTVDPSIAASHTGHGIVMPQCNHGGPGRAGNGEELGGLHGLRFYHQRVAIQGSADLLQQLMREAVSIH